MLFWDIPLVVVTSFSTAFILELHRTEEGCFVSYSPRIDADKSTKLFRAILGLTLVALKIVDYEQFTVDAALAAYKRRQAVEKANSRHTRSAGSRGGATSGRGASGSKSGSGSRKKLGSGASTKRAGGKDTCASNRKKSTSKSGTRRPLDISTVDGLASTYDIWWLLNDSVSSGPASPSECDQTAPQEPGNSVIVSSAFDISLSGIDLIAHSAWKTQRSSLLEPGYTRWNLYVMRKRHSRLCRH